MVFSVRARHLRDYFYLGSKSNKSATFSSVALRLSPPLTTVPISKLPWHLLTLAAPSGRWTGVTLRPLPQALDQRVMHLLPFAVHADHSLAKALWQVVLPRVDNAGHVVGRRLGAGRTFPGALLFKKVHIVVRISDALSVMNVFEVHDHVLDA